MISQDRIGGTFGSLIVVQVKRYQHIQRVYGADILASVMIQMSERLITTLSTIAKISKLSSDKFVIFLSCATQHHRTLLLLTKEVCEDAIIIADKTLFVHIGMGIATMQNQYRSVEEYINEAELAIVQHPDHFISALDNEYDRVMRKALEIENKLHLALQQNAFTLVYQPIVETFSESTVGVEALVRWRWKPNEFISPAEFIPVAEEAGLILPLSKWIIKTACIEFAGLLDDAAAPLYLSINISPRDLTSDGFVDVLVDSVRDNHLSMHNIQLEITEHALMNDLYRCLDVINYLQSMGVRIALDDFGTGHSSLNYLNQLPLNSIKIDRSFFINIQERTQHSPILRAIIIIANELGLSLTAEGIETHEQLEYLRANEVEFAQGFYFNKPKPLTELMLDYQALCL